MSPLRHLFPAFALLSLVCLHAQASTFVAETKQVKARLIASVDAAHPGDEILIGVHQRIIPHWHTYWKNPGDSGLATTIDYDLPAGTSVGEIQWPTPGLITLGPVNNYGYENEVTLLTSVTIPEELVAGGVFPVKAKVKWLVCKEICIPQHVDLALDIPLVSSDADTGQGSPLIKTAQASLPETIPWPVNLRQSKEILSLRITDARLRSSAIKTVRFYPEEWGRISYVAEQLWRGSGDTVELQLKPGDAPLTAGQSLIGVLTITQAENSGTVTRGYSVKVAVSPGGGDIIPIRDKVYKQVTVKNDAPDLVPLSALLLAFLGGVSLNLMPCVFPVLSIKALSLIKQASQNPRQTRLNGLSYTLGILASFAVLGGVLLALKAAGAQVGWGFQFQSPLFVLAVANLMFAVGLSLSGVFSIGGSVSGIGSSLAQRTGYSGSFFTGVLATLVATPCTAPFMGAALGFALTQPPVTLMAIFFSLGLGLALPFLFLSLWPFLQRRLPRPGAWMERFKQGLAFPMYGAAVWLVWVLAQQTGVNAVAAALGGMVIIAFAAWLYELTKSGSKSAQRSGTGLAGISLGLAFFGGYYGVAITPAALSSNIELSQISEPYSAARLNELRSQGKPVFLNLTAAWCISCLVNEKIALSQDSVIATFKRSGITYLKGDWTNRDEEITRILAEFGRSGVPLYVFYPAGTGKSAKPVVLPQLLTPEIVETAVTPPSTALAHLIEKAQNQGDLPLEGWDNKKVLNNSNLKASA